MKIIKLVGTSLSKNGSDYEFAGIDEDNNKIDICYRLKRLVVLSNNNEILNIKNQQLPDNINLSEIQDILKRSQITIAEGVSLENSLE